jgi:hypothetical protein
MYMGGASIASRGYAACRTSSMAYAAKRQRLNSGNVEVRGRAAQTGHGITVTSIYTSPIFSSRKVMSRLRYSRANVLLLLTALTTSCATSTQSVLPDGRVAHEINCVGFGDCRKKAESLCHGRGYERIGGAYRLPKDRIPQSEDEIVYRYLIITCKQ